MISRRILAAVALLCAFIVPAHAQKTKAELNAEIITTLPDNTSGQITPLGLRTLTSDIIGSIMPTAPVVSGNFACYTGTTGLLQDCGVAPSGIYLSISGDCTVTSLGVITCTKTNGAPFGTMSGQNANSVAITGGVITGMPSPTNSSDVATKNYVDSVATGLNVLAPSAIATVTALPNSPTYSNGASGVGATLTAGSNTTLTVDGAAATLNTVVLVKNQSSAFQNGIYTVTQVGSGSLPWILTRTTYFDQAAEMKAGSYSFITTGTANANSAWVLQAAITTVGTDALNWILFSSAVAGVSQLDGSVGVISVAAGSLKVVSGQLSSNVLASRAFAASQNLSIFTSVQTLGYASPGDGGGATFKNVGSAPFIDSFISTGTIAGGSGYTTGTYYGALLSGGTGRGAIAKITVAAGAVTAVDLTYSPGNAYSVGDVLTVSNTAIGGTGSGFTFTVTAVTAPLGSFTDSGGVHFQYVTNEAPYPNIRQFGAKLDWDGVDGTATDDFNAVQAAIWFATYRSSTFFDSGGFWGGTVMVPSGSALLCGNTTTSLVISEGVTLSGAGTSGATTLKMCDAFGGATNFIELGDPNWHFACFNMSLTKLSVFSLRSIAAAGGTAMVHTNCAQDFGGLRDVYFYSGGRSCLIFEKGYGGASQVVLENLSCTPASVNNAGIVIGSTNPALNYGSTNISFRNIVVGGPSSANFHLQGGIIIYGGFGLAENIHCENVIVCLEMAIPATGNGDLWTITNINAGSGAPAPACTGVIQLDGTNQPGNAIISQVPAGSCANVVTNAQTGGINQTTRIRLPKLFDPN